MEKPAAAADLERRKQVRIRLRGDLAIDPQLYERRKKRLRREWLQTFTNILYIKIPVYDPDRLLNWMLNRSWFGLGMRWIFTTWFLYLSVGVMLAAILLVLTHFQTFRDRLP